MLRGCQVNDRGLLRCNKNRNASSASEISSEGVSAGSGNGSHVSEYNIAQGRAFVKNTKKKIPRRSGPGLTKRPAFPAAGHLLRLIYHDVR